MITQTKAIARQEKAVVKWKGEQITVTFHDVKTLICPLATDQETAVFLKTCQSLNLNPFAGECYLIKYSEEDKAAFVISINSYLKAAELNDNYNGCEAGILLRDSSGKVEDRPGAFLLDDEMDKLVGGWARVYRKDRGRPTYMAVNKTECIRYTKSGNPTRFWTKAKQPSMLRKVALKRALVEAFPSLFVGTLATAEVSDDIPEAEYEVMPEGTVPPALDKEGKPHWKKFYARMKSELGLTPEQAHELVGTESFNDLLKAGWTMEKIWDEVVAALQRQKTAVTEQVIDTQTGEVITQEEDLFGDEKEAGAATEEKPTGTAVPARLKRDPHSIKDINTLLKTCHDDFKLQPKQVYAELNVSGPMEITDLVEAYQRIAAVRK